MAINRFVSVTLNTNTGANPRAIATMAGADGGNVTLAIDSAVITTEDQLRACVAAALQLFLGQLTGP